GPGRHRHRARRRRDHRRRAAGPGASRTPRGRGLLRSRLYQETRALVILPTSVIGSHGLPGWVWLAREAIQQGRLGSTDVRELMQDATQIALLDQERAGV